MFEKIKKLSIQSGKTVEYTFYGIDGEPSVIGASATEANKSYLNAVLKSGKSLIRRLRGRKMSVAALQESREQDYKLYPQYVLKKFGNPPLRDDGSPAKDSDIEAFIRAIPVDMFDEMRTFFSDPDSFRGEEELGSEDIEDLSGN